MKFFVLILTILLLFSCKEESKKDKKIVENYKFLNEIAKVVDPESYEVKIYLDRDLPSDIDLREAATLSGKENYTLEGDYTLINDYNNRTIFLKFNYLTPNSKYNFSIDLSKLDTEKRELVGVFSSDFITKENSIILNTSLEKNEKKFLVKSTIRSTYNLNYENLKSSISFSNNDIVFDLKKVSQKEYKLTTQPFLAETGKINLVVKGSKLGLKENYTDDIYINKSNNFEVVDFYPTSYMDQKRLEIVTNGNFDGKDLSGFIRFDKNLNFRVETIKNKILIIGDFNSGEKYQFTILGGLKDKNNLSLKEDYNEIVTFRNKLPEIKFTSSGYIITPSKEKTIKLESINVKNVNVKLWKVYENNTLFFLKDGALNTGRKSRDFNWRTNELGDLVYDSYYDIKNELNRPTVSEIFIPDSIVEDKGFYIIGVTFDREDMLYTEGEFAGYNSNKNPDSYSYLYNNGRIYKSLSFTDLGISLSKHNNDYNFFINSINRSGPLKGAKIEAISPKNQIISTAKTDDRGLCSITTDRYFDIVKVSYKNDINYIKLRGSELNRSVYNIEGTKPKDENSIFFYTDRGVYRPGETINLTGIINNDNMDSELPVSLRLYTPDNRLKHTMLSKVGDGRIFCFELETSQNDPTGDWQVYVDLMDKTYEYTVKVHSVIPHKIRVETKAEIEENNLKFEIESSYLNGTAFSEANYSSEIFIDPFKPKFDSFRGYRFYSGVDKFQRVTKRLKDGSLNNEGRSSRTINLSNLVPEKSFTVHLKNKVYESSGRVVESIKSLDKINDDIFVGVNRSFVSRVDAGEEVPIKFIVVDREGNPIKNRDIDVKVYANESIWWYEYDNSEALKEFVNHRNTVLRESFNYKSKKMPVEFSVMPEPWGPLMVKIIDRKSGVESLSIIKSSWWDSSNSVVDAEILKISSDKLVYNSGDDIELTFDCEMSGTAFISIEDGSSIFYQDIVDLSKIDKYKFKAIDEMSPGVYANIRVYQPKNRKNSKPERLLGIEYIKIDREDMRSKAIISIPDKIEPLKDYTVKIDTKTGRKSYITISIVDEGLLNLTNFKTPSPDRYFYSKQLHDFNLYDNFSGVLDSYNGVIDRRFTIGGGEESEERERGLNIVKANRFKPVNIFSKIIESDNEGKCEYTFKIPNYTGSVRIMVTGRSNSEYISGDKDVIVKPNLAILPELPAVLGVNERVKIPLTLFCDSTVTENVEISVSHSEGLTIHPKTVSVEPSERSILFFEITTGESIGKKDIKFSAKSGKFEAKKEYEIAQRPSSPYEQTNKIYIIEPGNSFNMDIRDLGVLNTDSHNLTFGSSLLYGIKGRVSELIKYPYGCLEQTITKAYAQLFLKPMFKDNRKALNSIDNNINDTMKKIGAFTVSGGGFSLWEGDGFYSWVTLYTLQFIADAKKLGYGFNPNIEKRSFKRLYDYVNNEKKNFYTTLKAVPILQKEGYDLLPRLNYIREIFYEKLTTLEKAYLALGFKAYGKEDIGLDIYKSIDFNETLSNDYNYYCSNLSINAEVAAIMFKMGDKKKAYEMCTQIVKSIDSNNYISTYSMSQIMRSFKIIFGEISSGDQFELIVNGDKVRSKGGSIELNDYSEEKINIENRGESNIYLSYYHTYLPLKSKKNVSESSGIEIKSEWLDNEFKPLNFEKVKRNEEIYQVVYIGNISGRYINQVALSQVVPPGLKPINPAINKFEIPGNELKRTNLKELSLISMDYRDDRINLFFNLYNRNYVYVLKYNVTFEGDYYLPPIKAEAMYDGSTYGIFGGNDMKVVE
ncbi:MAG: hypothetical protein CR982_06035 [Candidatus Cloacimonadota bacterium]|nr:MAG: hypothetical protein CR982_06035 [Candidatus Cloacimonadota bacterium]PIE78079.1 MAG: hypothetical protein CSA15_09595 [Candidatus Delongbacteria bacterium]